MDALAGLQIDDFDGIVAQGGYEQALIVEIYRQVVDSSLDAGQSDGSDLPQRLTLLRAGQESP